MLDCRSTRRDEGAHRVLDPHQRDLESASHMASPRDRSLRPQQRRARLRAQICRLNGWCTALLVISSCCLPFALSSCGGSIVVNGTGTGAIIASPNAVTFGAVSVGQTASSTISLLNGGSTPVAITQLNLTGQSFSVNGVSELPITVAAGGTYNFNVNFSPAAAGAATGQLAVTSNSFTGGSAVISLSGMGAAPGTATLSSLSCTSSTLIGSVPDTCTVTLSTAAGSGGQVVSLASSNNAITLPSTVTVPAGAASAGFTATASAVSTAQAVTLTAAASGVSETFNLELNAALPTLSANATSIAFGNVFVNTATAPQSVTLTSTGTVPVTISAATLTGTGFTVSGIAFPATLSPGQAATLNVGFDPTSVGTATGQLTIASNSSTGSSALISLSGSGTVTPAALSALSCSSGAMTGSGTDACTVTLTASAPSGGLIVNLSSSSSAVTVPSVVTVPAGATSAGFTATVSSVGTAQAVTMTASGGSVIKSLTLQLNAAVLALSINATSIAFGEVQVNAPATQSVTLTSTGTVPVTITGATLTGAGFTLPGAAFPAALNPGQENTLNIEFDPAAPGAATGQLTIASNSSTNGTTVIGLTGTGTAAPVVAVAVTPSSVSTNVGTTQQFAASVSGTSNTAATWTVSGQGCNGTACGTISSTGLYIAPATVPSPASVTISATSVSDTTKSGSASVTIVPPAGATYYLAPAAGGGNDSNNGTSSSTPWLSPNHAVNCGDVIIAEAGSYSASNFAQTKWGKVNCSAGNNVAWLECATFDACTITTSGASDMQIASSYWGVQGWGLAVTGTGTYSCVFIGGIGTGILHHIVLANNVINGCPSDGIESASSNTATSFDYVAYIANVVYGAAGGNTFSCSSGMSFYQPIAYDSNPGTHIYVAGNFSFVNADPPICSGKTSTDGQGLILDTFDGSQGGLPNPYSQQVAVENNMFVSNGSYGFEVLNNAAGSAHAGIYASHNTYWGNNITNPQNTTWCSQVIINNAYNVQESYDLSVTGAATGCDGNALYAYFITESPTNTNVVDSTWGYSATGTNEGTSNSAGFSYGSNNTFGTNPQLANPVIPGAPSCGSASSVPSCMAPVIANFMPTNPAAVGYGYQSPNRTAVSDPLFPQWLCNVNLPQGLLTMGCAAP